MGQRQRKHTIPLVLIFPLSRYSIVRGKQKVCEKEPMIYWLSATTVIKGGAVVKYPDFVAENLGWWPSDASLVLVNTIDEERSSSTDVVDGFLNDGFDSSRLYDDVKSKWVVCLQFIPLGPGVLPERQ